MKFEDLDKIFQNYVKEVVKRNPDRYADHEKLEDDLGKLFDKFCVTRIVSLGKITPIEYAAELRKNGEIEDYVAHCLNNNIEISDIITDELEKESSAVDFLNGLLYESNSDAGLYAVTVLAEIGGGEVTDIFIKLLTNGQIKDEIKSVAYAYLSDGVADVADKILEIINTLPENEQGILVEVLSNFKGRKEIFYWLITMLQRADDVPLYAGLLGSYGDAAAVDILKSFAVENDINYMEYVEIRNAVEELGGDMDGVEKDFADDPYYKYMNGGSVENSDGQNSDNQ